MVVSCQEIEKGAAMTSTARAVSEAKRKVPSLKKRPSIAFISVGIVYFFVVLFFLWGVTPPKLDRIWTLYHEIRTGQLTRLKNKQRRMLTEAMLRYPELASDLLDGAELGIISQNRAGWISTTDVVILRTSRAKRFRWLKIEVQTPRDLLPYHLVLRGSGWKIRRKVSAQGRMAIELPEVKGRPELIELQLIGKGLTADPSTLGMHLKFSEAK